MFSLSVPLWNSQPDALLSVGKFVESITGGSKDTISDFVTGPIGFGVFLVCVLLIWVATLLVLKWLGRERAGCAAGFAFYGPKSSFPVKIYDISGGATRRGENGNDLFTIETIEANNDARDCEGSHEKGTASNSTIDQDNVATSGARLNKVLRFSVEPKDIERRKFLTRLVFCFFSNIALLCCTLLLTLMYNPLKDSVSGVTVEASTQFVEDIDQVLETIDGIDGLGSIQTAMSEITSLTYDELCGNVPIAIFEAQFGFNPDEVIETVANDRASVIPQILSYVDSSRETGEPISEGVNTFIDGVTIAGKNLWPLQLVISLTIVIILSQLAMIAVATYNEEEFKISKRPISKRFEKWYTLIVISLQMILVLVSFVLLIAFCFGVIGTYEVCTPSITTSTGTARGTPEDFLIQFMDFDDNTASKFSNYVTGCQEDPLEELIEVQKVLQESLQFIETELDTVKSIDLVTIEQQCGQQSQIQSFYRNIDVLEKEFLDLNKVLKQTYDTLSCPRINSLYGDVVHDALCTDFAVANANGFVLTIVVTLCSMILIGLRSAWRTAI